jgi:aryl-alcohol dehydrogenase-like predicted oxidoreductase
MGHPIRRGFLTGVFPKSEDVAGDDFHSTMPRFQVVDYEHNLRLVEKLREIAREKG